MDIFGKAAGRECFVQEKSKILEENISMVSLE